jgi:formate C-acetyltransferase
MEDKTMPMTERVRSLRQHSLEAIPIISTERAELLTAFYSQKRSLTSQPVLRALAFQYLLEHKHIGIYDGELIVGEKGPAPKAAPTYPELCCHSLEDLDILNTRQKIPYKVSQEARRTYAEKIIPFWQGASMREMLFRQMTPAWEAAYESGIFTEFMEQRAPGHTVLDGKIYYKGMLDFLNMIEMRLQNLDYLNDSQAYAKQEQLNAMAICARALVRYAERYSELALELAAKTSDPTRKSELERITAVCRQVPAHAPRDFWEALQSYWFVHLGVTIELNTWDAFCPGHLDQHLYPFYEQGLRDGTLTHDQAQELLHCFWIKFNNQPAPPKVGVTAAESGTYTDFAQINLGGVYQDGSDAVNAVTYLLLDTIEEMRLLQPSSSIQVSKKNPDRFIQHAGRIIRTGFGQPSAFNADLIVQELVRMGKSVEDARQGGSSGCVEVGAFGKENYNLTGYFNLPKVLELTSTRSRSTTVSKSVSKPAIRPGFTSFDELFTAFEHQLNYFIDIKVRRNPE